MPNTKSKFVGALSSARAANQRKTSVVVAILATLLAACNAAPNEISPTTYSPSALRLRSSPIHHVVIIVQENRSVDNLFQYLVHANTQLGGLNFWGSAFRSLR